MKNLNTSVSTQNETITANSKKKENHPHHPKIKSNKDIYQKVTDLIIEKMEHGQIAWEHPLINNCRPQNLITGNIYKGINHLLLSLFEIPYSMTFKQAKNIGASIKKGAKSLPVVYWNISRKTEKNEETGDEHEHIYYFLKYYNVFSIDDIENIPEKYLAKTRHEKTNFIEIKSAERIIKNFKNAPKFEESTSDLVYIPSTDTIRLAKKEYFKNSTHYYSSLFHEMAHSTGHFSRLNRLNADYSNLSFGSKDYAKEELTAELSASFLMAETGENINIENRAAYIQDWLTVLKSDKRMIVYAAAKAEKAVDYILNR